MTVHRASLAIGPASRWLARESFPTGKEREDLDKEKEMQPAGWAFLVFDPVLSSLSCPWPSTA